MIVKQLFKRETLPGFLGFCDYLPGDTHRAIIVYPSSTERFRRKLDDIISC